MAIHERWGGVSRSIATTRRWSFVTADLDEARETIWDLGVALAEGDVEPRPHSRWRRGRSLLVRDPDGHEIELVERLPLDELYTGFAFDRAVGDGRHR